MNLHIELLENEHKRRLEVYQMARQVLLNQQLERKPSQKKAEKPLAGIGPVVEDARTAVK